MTVDSDVKMKKPDRRAFVGAWKELTGAFVSAFAPRSVKPDSSFLLNIWLYVRQQMEAVVAKERTEGRVQADQHGPLVMPFGSVFKIKLKLTQGLRAEEPLATLHWEGTATKAAFQVTCLPEAAPGPQSCQAEIWVEGRKVAVLDFELDVEGASGSEPTLLLLCCHLLQ